MESLSLLNFVYTSAPQDRQMLLLYKASNGPLAPPLSYVARLMLVQVQL